eukprot:m.855537 g.855537  ORF g.855537 m.855537 type:complete len:165 (-) comp59625_c0_seq24:2184-2678(-)
MFVGERYGLAGQCSAMYMSVERRADALHLTRTAPLRAYLPAIGGAVGAGIVVQVVSSWLLPAVLLLLVALALLPENEVGALVLISSFFHLVKSACARNASSSHAVFECGIGRSCKLSSACGRLCVSSAPLVSLRRHSSSFANEKLCITFAKPALPLVLQFQTSQ